MKIIVDAIIVGTQPALYGADVETSERFALDCRGIDISKVRHHQVVSVELGAPSTSPSYTHNVNRIETTNLFSFDVRITEFPLLIRGNDELNQTYELKGAVFKPGHIDDGRKVSISITKRALVDMTQSVDDDHFYLDEAARREHKFRKDRLVSFENDDVITLDGCHFNDVSSRDIMKLDVIGGCRNITFDCSARVLKSRKDPGGGFSESGKNLPRNLVDVECLDGPYKGRTLVVVWNRAAEILCPGTSVNLREARKCFGVTAVTAAVPS